MRIVCVVWRAPELLIFVGCCVFILMLALSAYWEPGIRWLHFFQAWMYIATIVLGSRKRLWGYFIGFSAARLVDVRQPVRDHLLSSMDCNSLLNGFTRGTWSGQTC